MATPRTEPVGCRIGRVSKGRGDAAVTYSKQVARILRDADERAFHLLQTHRDMMERLVDALLQREELLKEEIDQILNGANNGFTPSPLPAK